MNVLKPHVSLNVSNIDASVAFYEKAFGVQVTKRRPGYAKFDLTEPSLNLTMQEAPRTGSNASHFGVQVASTEDVVAATPRCAAAGLATKIEEDTACCYAVQDKVWIEDPDGNAWEVFVVKGEAAVMGTGMGMPETAAPAASTKSSGCCVPKLEKATGGSDSGGCC